jgi:hypothetical protein
MNRPSAASAAAAFIAAPAVAVGRTIEHCGNPFRMKSRCSWILLRTMQLRGHWSTIGRWRAAQRRRPVVTFANVNLQAPFPEEHARRQLLDERRRMNQAGCKREKRSWMCDGRIRQWQCRPDVTWSLNARTPHMVQPMGCHRGSWLAIPSTSSGSFSQSRTSSNLQSQLIRRGSAAPALVAGSLPQSLCARFAESRRVDVDD